ncbi:MAG: hypothetical protein K2O81_03165, partial [Clostridia bacterium]|nr:hypothetical protein [Clostridia bacterium]
LKNISGSSARLVCTHRGREIINCEPRISVIEGVKTTPDSSVMTPFVEKSGENNRRIRVRFTDGGYGTVREGDIEVKFDGVKVIEGETG